MGKPVRLNIGCGDDIRPGYLNIDPFAEESDLRMEAAKLGFDDHSVDDQGLAPAEHQFIRIANKIERSPAEPV